MYCIHICIQYIYIYIFLFLYMYLFLSLSIYIYIHIHTYKYDYMHATHIYIEICMYVCMYVCMFLCMYECMCACIYIYIYIYKDHPSMLVMPRRNSPGRPAAGRPKVIGFRNLGTQKVIPTPGFRISPGGIKHRKPRENEE